MMEQARIKIEPAVGSIKPVRCMLVRADGDAYVLRATFRETALPVIDGRPQLFGPVYRYLRDAFYSRERQAVSIMSGEHLVERRIAIVTDFQTEEHAWGLLKHTVELRPLR